MSDIVKDIDSISEKDLKNNEKKADKILGEEKSDKKIVDNVLLNKKKKNKSTWNFILALSLIILVVAIASYAKFKLEDEEDDFSYNGFEFVKQNKVWNTQVYFKPNLINLTFFHHPTELENISINPLISDRIRMLGPKDYLFLAFDEDVNNTAVTAGVQISRLYKVNLLKVPPHSAIFDINLNVTEYMAEEDDGSPMRINCDMTNDRVVVIRFFESDETGMNFVDDSFSCINLYVEDPADFRKYADKFVYEYIGIVK